MSVREEMKESNPNPEKKPESLVDSLYEWIEAAIFSLTVVVLVFAFLFRIVGVDGESMQNTLMDNERLIVSRLLYTPQRGDIVIINRHSEEPLVKRIIAVGGDTIEIREGQVYLNGGLLNEKYLPASLRTPSMGLDEPVTVPEGYLFVMGDNRPYSKDSRDPSIGLVDVRDVMGKAVYRIWPMSSIGGLYD